MRAAADMTVVRSSCRRGRTGTPPTAAPSRSSSTMIGRELAIRSSLRFSKQKRHRWNDGPYEPARRLSPAARVIDTRRVSDVDVRLQFVTSGDPGRVEELLRLLAGDARGLEAGEVG